jgi:hypothetical protein
MGSSHKHPRQRSETPPAQPLSKRDKRRTALSDRLIEITSNFSSNRDMHYRHQLQAIQIDISLITNADLNAPNPLEDRGEDVDDLIYNISGGIGNVGEGVIGGKLYSEFAREIGDAMEQRDSALVAHNVWTLCRWYVCQD